MITGPIRRCELLVGLRDVNVLAVEDTTPWRVHVKLQEPSRRCPVCGEAGVLKERRRVELVDLAVFGRPVRSQRRLRTGLVDQPGRSDRSRSWGMTVRAGRFTSTSRTSTRLWTATAAPLGRSSTKRCCHLHRRRAAAVGDTTPMAKYGSRWPPSPSCTSGCFAQVDVRCGPSARGP